jgi:hypothetical protein
MLRTEECVDAPAAIQPESDTSPLKSASHDQDVARRLQADARRAQQLVGRRYAAVC